MSAAELMSASDPQRTYHPKVSSPYRARPTVAISSPRTFPNVLHYWGKSTGGLVMRMIAALAVLSAFLVLGGCFHHIQVYTAEPQVLPPLK